MIPQATGTASPGGGHYEPRQVRDADGVLVLENVWVPDWVAPAPVPSQVAMAPALVQVPPAPQPVSGMSPVGQVMGATPAPAPKAVIYAAPSNMGHYETRLVMRMVDDGAGSMVEGPVWENVWVPDVAPAELYPAPVPWDYNPETPADPAPTLGESGTDIGVQPSLPPSKPATGGAIPEVSLPGPITGTVAGFELGRVPLWGWLAGVAVAGYVFMRTARA